MEGIPDFFENFKADFKTFDGAIISERFFAPFVAVGVNGEITSLENKVAIASYFQRYLDDYSSKGVVSCAYKDLESTQINKSSSLATVSWELFNQSGATVIEWRESYGIVESQGVLKVFATYDH